MSTQKVHAQNSPSSSPKNAGMNGVAIPAKQMNLDVSSLDQTPSERIQQSELNPQLSAAPKRIQRYVFVKGTQVPKTDPLLSAEEVKMASDTLVRNYDDRSELFAHSAGATDYLGNLPSTSKSPGTWMRFNPKGINILGESHIHVPLQEVTPAVGTTNFVRERFSSDDMSGSPEMQAAYMKENAGEFAKMGITGVADKQKFGGESLFPKMGIAMTWSLAYLNPAGVSRIKAPNYVGKPLQRYFKIAWGYTKDVEKQVKADLAAKKAVSPQKTSLATVYNTHKAALDPYLTALPVDGYLGDSLSLPANSAYIAPLKDFAEAFSNLIVEMAADEPSSRLPAAERTRLKSTTISTAEKDKLFSEWRNHYFQDIVAAAAKKGVRYAGMGKAHLDHLLKVGLPANGHAFDMINADISSFETDTALLKAVAVP